MADQLHLFRAPKAPPKRKPRTLFVIDSGHADGAGPNGIIRCRCDVCGHETGWLTSRGVGPETKGRVCPHCKGVPNRETV